ncbi:MAG: choice-of-anchor J domain-containing protein [Ignavibacteria bacterium]|nr:choice-of-anchor J domain-containing protein [Ignavibacteria bacterium]MDH7527415.1 choice-of-anchor J domain-containing protein [Ignavibacteria bacterium]
MKRVILSLVLLVTFFTMAYSQYAESFFTSNPNYKQELEKAGVAKFSIPATVNYKPLGVINWSEGFEGTTFPPTGWAVHQLDGGTNTWIRYTTSPIFGTASAAVRWESSTLRNDDWLVTPQFQVNPGAFLNFYAKRQSTSYFDSVEIYYSTTGGVPPTGYNYITTIMPAGTTPELFQIPLNALAGQNIYIAFRYKELDQFRFYLDSVYVETPVALDAGIAAINKPKNLETTLGTTPQFVVKNFGANPTGAFQATFTIQPGGYTQTVNVSSLNSGESVTIDLPAWVPANAGNYVVTAYTNLSGDLNPQNDTLRKFVSVTQELPKDFTYNVSSLYPGGVSLYGLEFDGNYFYVSKWNENKIYRINKTGTQLDSFTINGISSTSGLRDLAWDGQYLYGSTNTTTVYQIDVSTFNATTAFTSPISVRGIAYDKANDAFWVCNWSTDLRLVSRTGTTLQTITAASHGLTGMSGIAYDTLTAGGPFIWVLNGGSATDEKILYKILASSGSKVDSFLITHHLPEGAIGGGVFVSDKVVPGSITLGVLNQGTPHLINGYRIGGAALQPSITVVHPNGGEVFNTNSKEIIVWKSQNYNGNVDILVSLDGGLNFQPLALNVANTGFYSTTTPEITTNNGLIAIRAAGQSNPFDVSDGPFSIVSATNAQVNFPIVVTDGMFAQSLRTGLDPTATDGFDSNLGEYELPPVPPATVFDARLIGEDIGVPQLGNGTYKDFRQGTNEFNGQKIHEVKYQVSQVARLNGNPITLYWDLPSNVTGRLQDLVTGSIIDVQMTGSGSYTVENPSLYNKLKITYTYTYTPPVTGQIKILYPNGGEVLKRGSNFVMAWLSNVPGKLDLYGSTNGGANWILLEDSLNNTGVYGGDIGFDTPESNQWKLKLVSQANPTIFDETDGTFSIQGTKLVYLDNPFVISDGNSSVGLFYGIDPSATDGLDPALGEAELPPPPPTGVFDGRFVGTDIGIPQLGQGTLRDYRQGGSTFAGNKIHEIQYQVGSGDSLRLFWYLPPNVTGLLQDFFGGALVNVPMNGAGKFTVPNPGILNKLKITLTYTAAPAMVQVIQPNGGENLFVGQTYQIVWNASGINNVKLEYSTNGGSSWNYIATVPAYTASKVKLSGKHPKDPDAVIEGTLGTYSWVVPNTPSNQCLVRVSDNDNPAVFDVSDNFFSISAPMSEGWVVQNSGTTAELYSVSAVNENVAWACGAGGVVIRTTNGGQTWQTVTSPRAVDAYVIWALSADKAFVGTSGTSDAKIHMTTNGGQTWTDVYTIAGGFLNVIRFIDNNNGWAQSDPVGGNWVLLKTTNGGLNWSSMATVPQAGSEYGWNNSGWDKSGYMWFGTNNSRIYYSTNNGTNWSFAPTTSANAYAVAFDGNLNGLSGFASGILNKSTNGGASWFSITSPTSADVTGISTVDNNEFFVAAGGSVWKTTDGGNNWTMSYGSASSIYHLSLVPTLTEAQAAAGWAVGAGGLVIKYRRQIQQPAVHVVQPNGGENWPVGSTQNIIWDAQLISNVKLEYTTNNGATWINIATVPAAKVKKVKLDGYSPKDPNGVIEGNLGVYAWTIPNTPSTQCKVRVSDASNPAVYDESDNVFTISEGVIGENWIVQNSGTTATLYSVSTVNANVAWVTGVGGVVIKTTNGGATWQTVTPPRAVDAHVICGVSADKALVATNGTSDAVIHITTNGGQTWQNVVTVPGGFINVIIMFDDMNGFAQGDPVGGNWTLLKTTDGGFTWTPAATVPQAGSEYGWNNSGWNVGNTLWFGTNNSRVYKSTDGGATWTYSPTTVVNSYSVAFGNALKGVVGSATGTANRSTDGGNSWVSITTPATGNILGMTSVSENEYWFTSNTFVYYSSDHGTNWSTGFTATQSLYHLHFKSLGGQNAVGYAVGANGYVVKYFRGPVTPQVVVVAPNGGENWTVGSTRQIVWNAQAVQNVKLEYSTNNGASWNYIATVPALTNKLNNANDAETSNNSVEGTLGTYNWVIPNTPSNQCLVKVSDASNPAVFDVSDNVFTISTGVPGPQLQFNYDVSALAPGVYSLYGSEFDGEYFYITRWNEAKIFRVNKSGTQIDSFNVTGLPSGGFRDLAFDGQYLYGSNNSTTVYRIDRTTFAATAAFTSPIAVRGISYNAAQNAFWVANWSTDIVLVSRTGATLYTIPAAQHGFTGMSGNAYDTLSPGGPYLWVFSGGTATDPKVLYKLNPTNGQRLDSIDVTGILPDGAIGGGLWVTDQYEPNTVTLGGSSQGVPHKLFGYKIHEFGPIPGTVTVLSPNGGEKYYRGQWQLIVWKSYEFDNRVKIKVSSDGGNTYMELASNVPNNGVFAVQVPNDASLGNQYKIRIESQSDPTKYDETDGTFEVAAAPYTLPLVDLPMVVTDVDKTRILRFGLDPQATDGIDAQFGEEELPPAPPAGVLDGRFIGDDIGLQLGQGLAYDYRTGRTNVPSIKVHELKFQKGSGPVIEINVYLPNDVTARFESFTPGFDTTVRGTAKVVVFDSTLNKLKVTLNYFPGSALGTFNLFGPINNALVTARQNDSTVITFRWYRAKNAVSYRLRMGVPTIPPFMLDTPSNNGGADSLFTIRQYELFNIFSKPSYPVDTTVTGQWAVWAYGASGDSVRSNSVYSIRLRLVKFTGVDNEFEGVPTKFVVYQNYPNPFNPSTKIKFGLPEDADVTIEVFNVVGEKVATLLSGNLKKGYHEVNFDAAGLQSGVYFYKVNAGKFSTVKKMLLIK